MLAGLRYLASLPPGKQVLWCYLIWYLITVDLYFDPEPRIWLNSCGISAIIGLALLLSVGKAGRVSRWQTFRLFFMPFGVSSFSALTKGHGFLLILPPQPDQCLLLFGACAAFLTTAQLLRRWGLKSRTDAI